MRTSPRGCRRRKSALPAAAVAAKACETCLPPREPVSTRLCVRRTLSIPASRNEGTPRGPETVHCRQSHDLFARMPPKRKSSRIGGSRRRRHPLVGSPFPWMKDTKERESLSLRYLQAVCSTAWPPAEDETTSPRRPLRDRWAAQIVGLPCCVGVWLGN